MRRRNPQVQTQNWDSFPSQRLSCSLCHRQCPNSWHRTPLSQSPRSNGREWPILLRDYRQHRQPSWLASHFWFRHLRPSSWRTLMPDMVTAITSCKAFGGRNQKILQFLQNLFSLFIQTLKTFDVRSP